MLIKFLEIENMLSWDGSTLDGIDSRVDTAGENRAVNLKLYQYKSPN